MRAAGQPAAPSQTDRERPDVSPRNCTTTSPQKHYKRNLSRGASYDTFGVWLSKRTYDRLTQAEIDLVCEFVLLDERPIEHEIWDRIGRFYREVSAAIGRARRGAEEAARAPESGEGAAAASSEPSAPSKAAAPKQQPKPQAAKPKAAPKLGISGPTKDLYFPSRRDPLRRGRAPAEEQEEEDTSGRPASEPRQRYRSRSVDLGAAGGAPRAESLTRSRRVRTPPRRRAQESRSVQELRLRGNLFAALAAEDSDVDVEVEVDEPAPKAADDPEQEEQEEQEEEQEQEAEPPAPEGAAFGAPGENAEGAEEEEAPEADVEVEVPPSGSDRTRSPSPSEATREVRVGVKRGSVTRRPLILAPATEAFPTVRVDGFGLESQLHNRPLSGARRPRRGCSVRHTRGTRKKHSVHLIRLICRTTLGWSPARSGRATLLGVFVGVLPCIPSATQGRKGLRARVLPLAHRPDRERLQPRGPLSAARW